MEKARESADQRARYQAKVVKFVTEDITGLARRVARSGSSSILGFLLDLLREDYATIGNGVLNMSSNARAAWAMEDEHFLNVMESFYLPHDGKEAEVSALLQEVVLIAEQVLPLLTEIRAMFSDVDGHGPSCTLSKASVFVVGMSSVHEWATKLRRGDCRRIECSWFYLYPKSGVTVADQIKLCNKLLRLMYNTSVADVPNDRWEMWYGSPMHQLDSMVARNNVPCMYEAGFISGTKQTNRLERVLREFGALHGKLSKVTSSLTHGHAMLYGAGTHVLCYANDRDRARAKLSVLPLARWLRTFDAIPDATVQKVVNAMRVGSVELLHTYAEWYKAYVETPDMGSCMSHAANTYDIFDDCHVPYAPGTSTPLHPIWCYADHEYLRLAVIRRGDDIVARAIVNTKLMQFYRVYGDYALHAALTCEGYMETGSFLDGVTLRSYLVDGRHLLHPYVDGDNDHADVEVIDDEYAELHLCGCGEIDVQNTNGGVSYYANGRQVYCEICDCYHCAEDEYEVINSEGDTVTDVCRSCYVASGTAYDEDDRLHHNVADGHTDTCGLSGDTYIASALVYHDELDMMVAPSELAKWEAEQEEDEE